LLVLGAVKESSTLGIFTGGKMWLLTAAPVLVLEGFARITIAE
jgi:hypothetical protein